MSPATGPQRKDRGSLIWRHGVGDGAYGDFLRTVFDVALPGRRLPPAWQTFGLFEAGGRCVASAEIADLAVVADGRFHPAGGLRLIGVVEDWRGQGLFRDLMEQVLRRSAGYEFVLLYAAEPDLYRRFGFEPVPQHAFVGAAPEATAAPAARPLPERRPTGDGLVERLLARRAAVSDAVSLVGAPALFLDAIAADDGVRLAHLPGPDALIAYEEEDDTLILVDMAAAAMPTLAEILGALPRRYAAVRTLFPPDRLGWHGAPVADDTGLMARGSLPPALRRPFMLPPTAGF